MSSTTAKIKAVSTADRLLSVWLTDGRIFSLPLAWYPSLAKASPREREVWQPSGAGRGIHWPALDYDLSVEGLLAGQKEHPNSLPLTRQTRVKNQKAKPSPASTHRGPKRPIGKSTLAR